MNTEKLIRLGQELQAKLGFHPEVGLTQELYEEVLKLVHILADDDVSHDKNWALLDVLVPAIVCYDNKQN
ncbi:hypothetical protein H4J51_03050 [Colwellia sp. MB02u-18]|uniref:hypothetical protein n=1 Tax=unclassified Colwellia TaxID=196834 RepID=UPI0015F4A1CB|nr:MULTISPECIES: hypothetical protein [unclassified Colwellia]MBA6224224.1 hypothetical protein [Colwellia sp. MB3u-45]MBA6268353.1 hypothetical protein [Colwellia sp. MB3u-43]MBA6322694.1 hypothetical protein [Colwellia sp. MB02u-19]MBA6323555.1 hypothetical protein [Colwellia sp. MB02u-18]MBA6332837.1 hypothetical protein [Colwellia sp. MB02u-12]